VEAGYIAEYPSDNQMTMGFQLHPYKAGINRAGADWDLCLLPVISDELVIH